MSIIFHIFQFNIYCIFQNLEKMPKICCTVCNVSGGRQMHNTNTGMSSSVMWSLMWAAFFCLLSEPELCADNCCHLRQCSVTGGPTCTGVYSQPAPASSPHHHHDSSGSDIGGGPGRRITWRSCKHCSSVMVKSVQPVPRQVISWKSCFRFCKKALILIW